MSLSDKRALDHYEITFLREDKILKKVEVRNYQPNSSNDRDRVIELRAVQY